MTSQTLTIDIISHKTHKNYNCTSVAAHFPSLKITCSREKMVTCSSFWPAAKHHKENRSDQTMNDSILINHVGISFHKLHWPSLHLFWFIIVYILNYMLGGILYLANQLCLGLDLISFRLLGNFYWSISPLSYLLSLLSH